MSYWIFRFYNTKKKHETSNMHDAVVVVDDDNYTCGSSAANYVLRHISWKMQFVASSLTMTTAAMANPRIHATAKLQDIDSFNFYRFLA